MKKFLWISIGLCFISFSPGEAACQQAMIAVLAKNSGLEYKKLQVLAARHGVRLRTYQNLQGFPGESKEKGLQAVIYQQGSERTQPKDTEYLQIVYNIVRQGGKALCLPYAGKTDTDTMLDLFGVSSVEEKVATPAPTRGETYLPDWSGLRVGVKGEAGILQHYVLSDPAWIQLGTITDSSGKSRCVSAKRRLGQGEVLFLVPMMINMQTSWSAVCPFADTWFDEWDNPVAAEKMVMWLMGK